MKSEDSELCGAVWKRDGSDSMILDKPYVQSELVEKPQLNILRAAERQGPRPFNFVMNWAKAIWKDSGNAGYSKFRFQLPRSIEGYTRVSCTSLALTNVFDNLLPFYVGMNISEIATNPFVQEGNGGVFDQLGGTTISDTIPTFLLNTAQSYSSLVGTGLPANLKLEQGIITGSESYAGEYSVDVSGQSFSQMTVTLTSADFKRLNYSALNFTPALFSFIANLRFE